MKSACAFFIFGLLLYSCASSRSIRDSKQGYLLGEVKIMVNGENKTQDLRSFLNQHPVEFSFGKYVYHWVDTDYEKTFERWKENNPGFIGFMENVFTEQSILHLKYWYGDMFHKRLLKISDPPVYHGNVQTELSVANLQVHFKSIGYLDCEVTPQFFLKDDRMTVIYHVTTGPAYVIRSLEVTSPESRMAQAYRDTLMAQSSVRIGEVLLMENLTKEVKRIGDWFRDRGYYLFQDRFIEFELDTVRKAKSVGILLRVNPKPVSVGEEGLNFSSGVPYVVGRFDIHMGDINTVVSGDTAVFDRQARLISDENIGLPFDEDFIGDRLYLRSGGLFSEKHRRDTRTKLLATNNFSSVTFDVKPGGAERLDIDMYLSLREAYSVSVEPNIAYSESRWSVAGDLSLRRRNLFNYGEYLDISASGALGNLQNTAVSIDFWNSWSLNLGGDVVFQDLMFPFVTGKFDATTFPATRLSLSVELQKNIGLGKVFYTAHWSYSITQGNLPVTHRLTLMELQYSTLLEKAKYFDIFSTQDILVKQYQKKYKEYKGQEISINDILQVPPQEAGFIENNRPLHNEFLSVAQTYRRITDDYLIGSARYQFSYGRVHRNQGRSHGYFLGSLEWAGFYFSLWDRIISPLSKDHLSRKQFFNVAYSEFWKADFDFRYYQIWDRQQVLAARFFFGVAYPFGNATSIPFQKAYFAGGVTDIRAWRSYSLVSRLPNERYSGQILYTGDLKMLFSLEYRYPLYEKFHGAFFVDAGNIWSIDSFDRTYDQIGVGFGLGLRYDIGVVALRMDAAYKVLDPTETGANLWVAFPFQAHKVIYNLGLGYPF